MYVGIDATSRKIAVARLDSSGGLLHLSSYEVSRRSEEKELGRMHMLLEEYERVQAEWRCAWADRVAIEAPIIGRSGAGQTALGIAMAIGAIAALTMRTAATTELVAVSSWKKVVVGKGNAKKEEVDEWLRASRPTIREECRNQDEIDAVCLALHLKARDDLFLESLLEPARS